MKKFISLLLCLSILNIAPMSIAASIKVDSGIKIPLKAEEKYTSKTIVSGEPIPMVVAKDVYQNNVCVFKEGANAVLYVTDAKKAGFLGNAGEFVIVDGQVCDAKGKMHNIDFYKKFTGEEKTWPKVCLGCGIFIILAPLALFAFVKGGQAELYPTQTINVRLSESFCF